MRIDNLTLNNFRCFEGVELRLHREMTVLIGANGAGKTACVDGLGVAMQVVPMALGYAAPGIQGRDLRAISTSHGGYWSLDVAQASRVYAHGHIDDMLEFWSFEHRFGKKRNSRADAVDVLRKLRNNFAHNGKGNGARTMPVIALYGVNRLQSNKVPEKDVEKLPHRLDAYRTCIRPLTSLANQMRWIQWQATAAAQSGEATPHLLAVYRAAAACLPEATSVRFDIRSLDLWIEFKEGHATPYHLLSDGYKGILAMVIDIAWRCVTLNPHLAEKAPEETHGIVAIDEIDLHLHPHWQRRVLADLRQTFPRIQFIVTSHSPQVLASCQPEWVRVLSADGKVEGVSYVHGWDSNSVLRDIMDDEVRPREMQAHLDALSVAIHERRWQDAEARIEKLAEDLGPDAPELTRAWLDLHFEREVGGA